MQSRGCTGFTGKKRDVYQILQCILGIREHYNLLRPGNQHHSLHCGNLYPTTIELEVVGRWIMEGLVRPGDEKYAVSESIRT
jgi:hypothetical protein